MSASDVRNDLPDTSNWSRFAQMAMAAGLVVTVIGLVYPDTRVHALRAWLVAFTFYVGLSLGSLAIVMIQYLTGGKWGFLLRRPLEAAMRTLPMATLFYLPIAFGLPYLYEWADSHLVAESANLQAKALYLNPTFALVRAAIYFGAWNLLVYLFTSWSGEQDHKKDPNLNRRCEGFSGPGLVLHVLLITFASIDWVMSLEPEWYSTIYGAMFGMGQVLSAFALAVLVLMLLADRPSISPFLSGQTMRDLGSLLLAFVMVWAYLSFSQFLLIWSGNLPEEVPWYIYRLKGGWQYAGLALVVFHFALPFFLLLSRDVKRNRRLLGGVALLVLVMRLVDLNWLIVPAFGHGHAAETHSSVFAGVLYLGAVVAAGGAWVWYYIRQLGKLPLVPAYNPYEEGAVHGAATQH